MTEAEVRQLQTETNRFLRTHRGLGYTQLRVDGKTGPLTKKRVTEIKYLLGYVRAHINDKVDENFYHRMRNPRDTSNTWGQTKSVVREGLKRRIRRRAEVRKNALKAVLKPGVGKFDGKTVAKCAIPLLTWARANGWKGTLVSGWRDPKYSQSLCFNMCGRPSCPGKCAGLSSNHVGDTPAKFAMDVSDYVNFGHIIARCPLQPKVHNSLGARDPVHFSPSGN
jgi:hypothetical protein